MIACRFSSITIPIQNYDFKRSNGSIVSLFKLFLWLDTVCLALENTVPVGPCGDTEWSWIEMDGNVMGYEEFFSCYDLKHAHRTNSTTNNSLQFATLNQSTNSSTIGLRIMNHPPTVYQTRGLVCGLVIEPVRTNSQAVAGGPSGALVLAGIVSIIFHHSFSGLSLEYDSVVSAMIEKTSRIRSERKAALLQGLK